MKIQWIKIIFAGLVLEVAFIFYIFTFLGGTGSSNIGIISGLFFMLIGGYWVGIKASSGPILQGGMVGLVGVLLYTAVTIPLMLRGEYDPDWIKIVLNHLAKITGGSLGGFIALRTGKPKVDTESS